MNNRRTFQRFDIFTVLEFKLLTANAETFTGITRNFSYEGFCVETQCVAFEPGDSLEVKLRHPNSDLTISVPADVVWKRNADKFAYLMGIKFRETELDTKLRMLEIMSAAGDVPVDSFLSDRSDDDVSGNRGTGARSRDLNLLPADKPAPEPVQINDEETGPEAFREEESLSTREGSITGKKSVSNFDEVFKAAQAEGPDSEDMFNEEALESDMPWPKANTTEEKTAHSTHLLKQLLGNRIFIYSSISAVLLAVSVYTLSIIFKSPDNSIKSPVPAPVKSAYRQEEALTLPPPPVEVARDKEAAVPSIQQPDEQHISKTESSKVIEQKVPATSKQPADTTTMDDNAHYIQVGAWRVPDNAKEMLQKIKKYYPDAYLVPGTKLSKVKIPVKDKIQGNMVIKDIEAKFHIKPMLTPER
jgi:hypothetical protein